jgi:YHS domain-containing protein
MKTQKLVLTLAIGLFSYAATMAQTHDHSKMKPNDSTKMKPVEGGQKVPNSQVCFPNNRYMGAEQLSVEIDGKTYYGCCNGCIERLKNEPEVRYGVDPLTEKKVNKATAYIVIKPGSTGGEVLYFESKVNYQKFMKKNDKI